MCFPPDPDTGHSDQDSLLSIASPLRSGDTVFPATCNTPLVFPVTSGRAAQAVEHPSMTTRRSVSSSGEDQSTSVPKKCRRFWAIVPRSTSGLHPPQNLMANRGDPRPGPRHPSCFIQARIIPRASRAIFSSSINFRLTWDIHRIPCRSSAPNGRREPFCAKGGRNGIWNRRTPYREYPGH
jgi:hypothetical protein